MRLSANQQSIRMKNNLESP